LVLPFSCTNFFAVLFLLEEKVMLSNSLPLHYHHLSLISVNMMQSHGMCIQRLFISASIISASFF
jgi:hypothetical protein